MLVGKALMAAGSFLVPSWLLSIGRTGESFRQQTVCIGARREPLFAFGRAVNVRGRNSGRPCRC